MLSAIQRTIRTHALLARGDLVIVAVSGGGDSMALLHALATLAPRLGLGLEVATVDHGLRAEARAEGELVRARAEALGLP
ncbi:MAG TPA: ATP-binding protein, partial [Polyangia bacterium]|nr:ATP-binding protein [Polyangia bacterium]